METKTHLAIVQEEAKGPLVLRSVSTVDPGKGQIQVRVKAAGLNPIDFQQFALAIVTDKFPFIGGADVSGIVTKVGEGVTHVKEGDRISSIGVNFLEGPSAGTFQEYSTFHATPAIKIPDSVTFAQAAILSASFHTATVGVSLPGLLNLQPPWDPLPTPDETPILVWGGGSAVGRNTIYVLKAANYTNIITTASPYRFEEAKALGAKAVFNYKDADVVEQIQKYLGDKKLLSAFDAISSPESVAQVIKVVSPGGTVAIDNPGLEDILPKEGGPIKRVDMFLATITKPHGREFGRKSAEYLQKIIADGSYSFVPFQEIPGGLAGGGVQKGADMLRLNENHGQKLVVTEI